MDNNNNLGTPEEKQNENDEIRFLESLDSLKPDDIAPPKPKAKRSGSDFAAYILKNVLTAVCFCIMIGCLSYVVYIQVNGKKSNDSYKELANEFNSLDDTFSHLKTSPKTSPTPDYSTSQSMSPDDYTKYVSEAQGSERFARMKSKLSKLREKYPDLRGWITINGTVVDYPIMQSDDNLYYLNRHIDGTEAPSGSIFLDYRCSASIAKNYNTVIYGHKMYSTRAMFNDLDFYFEKSFFDNYPYIEICTLDGLYTYEVFAFYETNKNYHYIQTAFKSADEFVKFANEMQSNSIHKREGIEFTSASRILTLSTCTNVGAAGSRLTVQAVLVNVEK